MLATHDTGNRFGTVFIGDHIHARLELIVSLVEAENGFAVFGRTNCQIALDLSRIEDVQRATKIKCHVIGDIHQCIDWAQADSLQALLHPFRAWAVFHALDQTQCKTGAEWVLGVLIENNLYRRLALALRRFGIKLLECTKASGCKIARDAANTCAIGTVWREANFDDWIIKAHIGGKACADRNIIRQIDNAIVLFRKFKLALGAHHAEAFDTANFAD